MYSYNPTIDNLIRIGLIKKNEKVYIIDEKIYSYEDNFVNTLLRKIWYCENRARTYFFISDVIDRALYNLNNYPESRQNEIINNAMIGLNNLIYTYSDDIIYTTKVKSLIVRLKRLLP